MKYLNSSLNSVAFRIILFLDNEDGFKHDMRFKIDVTYSHITSVCSELIEQGVINEEKKGRIKLLNLTSKGKKIAEHLKAINEELK